MGLIQDQSGVMSRIQEETMDAMMAGHEDFIFYFNILNKTVEHMQSVTNKTMHTAHK